MNEQLLNLAKKIKALADKGIDGEKINAKAKLAQFLRKHNISESDLFETNRVDHVFSGIGKTSILLFAHVVWSVIPTAEIYGYRGSTTKHIVECSDVEFVEIGILYKMYKRAFDAEVKLFEKAFIMKNELYYKGPSPKNQNNFDMKEALKVKSMMNGIDSVGRFKALLKK